MQKAKKTIVRIGLVLAGMVALLALALVLPSVQKALVLRLAGQAGVELALDTVRLRPGSAQATGLSLRTPEREIEVAALSLDFRIGPLLREGALRTSSASVSGLSIVLHETAADPDRDPAGPEFAGLLPEPPFDFSVADLSVDGTVRTAGGDQIRFELRGRQLDSRAADGALDVDVELQLADSPIPELQTLHAHVEARPQFDAQGVFRQLGATLALQETMPSAPFLNVAVQIHRTDSGETYEIDLHAPDPAHAEPSEPLLNLRAAWNRQSGRLFGEADVDVARAAIPFVVLDEALPDFAIQGRTKFDSPELGHVHLDGDLNVKLAELAERFGLPAELDTLDIATALDMSLAPDRLSLHTLAARIRGLDGAVLARIEAPTAVTLGWDVEEWSVPESDTPLLEIDFPGIPPALFNLFLADVQLEADPITGRMVVYGRDTHLEIETPSPVTVRNLNATGPDGILLSRTDITAHARGTLSLPLGPAEADTAPPVVTVRGQSGFIDVSAVQKLAERYAPEEPAEKTTIERFLPFSLDAEWTAARVRMDEAWSLADVRIALEGDAQTVRVQKLHALLPGNGALQAHGSLATDGQSVALAAEGDIENWRIQEFLRQTAGEEPPNLEGVFAFTFQAAAQAPYWQELSETLDGALRIAGRDGRIRFSVPGDRMKRVQQILDLYEGPLGAAIAQFAGAPPEVQALAESLKLLTDVPYQTLDAQLKLVQARTFELESLELRGPYLYARGTGQLDIEDYTALRKSGLILHADFGARARLQQNLDVLGMLSDQRTGNYQMLEDRIRIEGALADLQLRALWDRLLRAVTDGARKEPRRRDPAEDAVDRLRNIFGL